MADRVRDSFLAELPHLTHRPGEAAYQAATTPHNASYEQMPSVVVSARSGDDVADIVALAARMSTRVVVQTSGHGVGQPVRGDQILLDTSALNEVTVNPTARTARVGAGTAWPRVLAKAAPHALMGLAGTSGSVGVAGYTFTGGVGWLVRKHGLASAAVRSVDFVDGMGRRRRACEASADLLDREVLWAFRGGGPVGIATTIEVALVPVTQLWSGYLLWPAAQLPQVASAWAAATTTADSAVTTCLALLRLPPEGPFPADLLDTVVAHVSYACPDGDAPLRPMLDALHAAAPPAFSTTGPGDLDTLTRIHLDPPTAVPARGTGRWMTAAAVNHVLAMFEAARIGRPDGLNMIEMRHTDSPVSGPDGALTTVPAPYLLHAIGAGPDEASRRRVDALLTEVLAAGRPADGGKAAPAFCHAQPAAADALTARDVARLRDIRHALDPHGTLAFHRHPAP